MSQKKNLNKISFYLLLAKQRRLSPTLFHSSRNDGFSLPLAVVIGFMLLLGGLALASRSNWSIFGSAFQNNTWSAKDAAEIGMNYFVNELNKPRNRWLNVVRKSGSLVDPDYDSNYPGNNYENNPDDLKPPSAVSRPQGDLWQNRNTSQVILELRRNPCVIAQGGQETSWDPQYGSSTGGLDPKGATSYNYGKWFINTNGSISSTQGTANRSFRLVKVYRQPYTGELDRVNKDVNGDGAIDAKDELLDVYRDRANDISTGTGKVTIQVEGQSYVNGQVVASVILEKEFELTPKCCGLPFGGAHGNTDYTIQRSGIYKDTSACLSLGMLGMGILGGSAGDNTGSITIRGRATNIEDDAGDPINPIFCLSSNKAGCAINVNATDINVAVVDATLPDAYTYINPPPGEILSSTRSTTTPGALFSSTPRYTSTSDYPDYSSNIASHRASGTERLLYSESLGGKDWVIVNGNANSAFFPSGFSSFCSVATDGLSLHCNVNRLSIPTGTGWGSVRGVIFLTGRRRIRLYFPTEGSGNINLNGTSYLGHCADLNPSSSTQYCLETRNDGSDMQVTDLSLFGSNAVLSTQQEINLSGNPDIANKFFIYFPTGKVSLVGDSTFEGILWTDDISSTGNPTWIVPGSGMTAVLQLMGYTAKDNPNMIRPIFYDFVLRATNRYRWIGG